MKKVILGGLIFIGRTILFSAGELGVAHVYIQANYMQVPQYMGIISMLGGLTLGIWGLKKE